MSIPTPGWLPCTPQGPVEYALGAAITLNYLLAPPAYDSHNIIP